MKFHLLATAFMFVGFAVFSQEYHISGPPVEGHFSVVKFKGYMMCAEPNNLIDITTDQDIVFPSGKGLITEASANFCEIEYDTMRLFYIGIYEKTVSKGGYVTPDMAIGKLHINPIDKKYHLGVKAYHIQRNKSAPLLLSFSQEKYWTDLLTYLKAEPVTSR